MTQVEIGRGKSGRRAYALDEIGIVPNMTPIMMHAQAARNALRDAGIELSEVDGVFTGGIGGMANQMRPQMPMQQPMPRNPFGSRY